MNQSEAEYAALCAKFGTFSKEDDKKGTILSAFARSIVTGDDVYRALWCLPLLTGVGFLEEIAADYVHVPLPVARQISTALRLDAEPGKQLYDKLKNIRLRVVERV